MTVDLAAADVPDDDEAETIEDWPIADPGEAEGEVIVVEGEAPAESASSVQLDRDDLVERPHTRPSDLLRQTPGLVVSQHAGGGKSDQYFLRGFDADHGTDVAIFVDGIPVNLTSHGHGQGYADTHWLIPETIASIDVHKGPYAARFGDFTTARAIEMTSVEPPPGATIWLTGGTQLAGPTSLRQPTTRLVNMASPELAHGSAVIAAELGDTGGAFLDPQDFGHVHLFAKGRRPFRVGEVRAAVTGYAARWNQSGQIPETEVDAGRLDRFGAIDPTEGGRARRGSASVGWSKGIADDDAWDLSAYALYNRLQLFSNFTSFARDAQIGDQIEENDDRVLGGAAARYRKTHPIAARSGLVHAGLELRTDSTVADLWHSAARTRLADCWGQANPCNRGRNNVVNLAAYVEEDLSVWPRLRLIGGLRADAFLWNVKDLSPVTVGAVDTIGGTATAAIMSPKLTAIITASEELDVFVNTGLGFHSNDARSAVASDGADALARATGAEAGVRLAVTDELRASAAAWYLHLESEQVWSGDLGTTEPSDPTRRYGLDLDWEWHPRSWLSVDANVSLGRSTVVANRRSSGALPLAPRIMGGGGVTLRRGGSLAAVRFRGIGDRPANDDGSLMAQGYGLVDVVAQRGFGKTMVGLTIENLLDADWREAQFAQESRVAPTAEVVEDVHFTPGAPLTALVTLTRAL